jgi:hypothetical protein
MLLALQRRGGDAIDPTERAALQQHLDACPDCTALAHSEDAIDDALGTAMRAVTVPAALKQRVLTRLALTQPRRWPRVAAAAAVLLLALGGTAAWMMRPLPQVEVEAVTEMAGRRFMAPGDIQQWYHERGIEMAVWSQLDQRHLWTFDIVEFQGRRVPKLVFFNSDKQAMAEVIVLRTSQFDTRGLENCELSGTSRRLFVHRDIDPATYVYLIDTPASSLDDFLSEAN